MTTAYVSGRVPARCERLVTKQAPAARTSKSDLVARYVIEKSLETEFPGISFRDSLSHFRWPRVLVKHAFAYAKAFPEEIHTTRDEETSAASAAR